MRFLAFVLLLLALASSAGAQTHPEVDRLRAEALRIAGAEVQEHPGFTMVIEPRGLRIHYFTKPGHFAHPGVVRRSVVQDAGGISIQTEGQSFASTARQDDFKRWLAQFRELDDRIKQEMKEKSGNSPR